MARKLRRPWPAGRICERVQTRVMLSGGAPRRSRNISGSRRWLACGLRAEIPRHAWDDSRHARRLKLRRLLIVSVIIISETREWGGVKRFEVGTATGLFQERRLPLGLRTGIEQARPLHSKPSSCRDFVVRPVQTMARGAHLRKGYKRGSC